MASLSLVVTSGVIAPGVVKWWVTSYQAPPMLKPTYAPDQS
jgi:hypothetical protein